MNPAEIEVRDPALDAVIARVPGTTAAELDALLRNASAAFPGWAGRGWDERAERLVRCGRALAGRRHEVAELLTREQGKPLAAALAEVDLAADWFPRTAELVVRPERLGGAVVLDRVPHGVVAAISPSNYPIILAVTKLAPALLAGNTVVLKPSPLTPLSTVAMGEILAEHLPPGVFAVALGGADTGASMVAHPDVRLVSFTGSVPSGRRIAQDAAARFTRVVLELGGNDACIVLPGADVGRIAGDIYRLATVNSGQFCAAVKRVYVPRALREELVDALAGQARASVVGTGTDPATELGPLVSGPARDRVRGLVEQAGRAGARVVPGAPLPDLPGHFCSPTVVCDLPPGTGLELEEQFGPVIPVIDYDDVSQALERANGTVFGLGGSVWGDPGRAAEVATGMDCGTVWINTHGVLRHDVPFGGTRCSGVGVEYGYWGLLEYTRIKVTHPA